MKFTLTDGREIEGTVEEIERFMAGPQAEEVDGWGPHGDRDHYISSSKGIIRIDEMHSNHIRNALLKMNHASDDLYIFLEADDNFEHTDTTRCALLYALLARRLYGE